MKQLFFAFAIFFSLAAMAQTVPSYPTIKLTKTTLGTVVDSLAVISNGTLKHLPTSALKGVKQVTATDGITVANGTTNPVIGISVVSQLKVAGLVTDLGNKVDKVSGKSLISDSEITRIATLFNYSHPTNHPPSIITQDPSNRFVTDAEKTAWNNKQNALGYTPENLVLKNAPNGYAGLGSDGKLIPSQLPSITISDTFVVGSQSAMLAVTAETGDVVVRTDLNKSFILKGTNSTVLADWQELLTPTSAVTTVFGRNGAIVSQTGDYNSDQITETATRVFQTPTQRTNNDATSSIQTQLNSKQANITAGTTSQYYRGDKTFQTLDKTAVGLANVQNTSDANKPISTATQTALNGKEDIANKQNSLDIDGKGVKFPTVDAVNSGLDTKISGSGTTNFIPKITGSRTVGDSRIFDDGTNIGIGTAIPSSSFSFKNQVTFDDTGVIKWGLNGDIGILSWDTGRAIVRALDGKTLTLGTGSPSARDAIVIGLTGNSMFKTTSDNGVDVGQFNGTISASPATLSNQVVVKSQLDLKANLASPTFTGTVSGVDKTMVGLSNVDNTSDTNKPISTATQTALNGKENSFAKNTAFNKNFGTTAGTVVEGGTLGSNAYSSTAYLPLSGGTLTGALTGTTATFASSVTATGFVNSTAPATNILLANGTTIPQTGVSNISNSNLALNADRELNGVPNVNGEGTYGFKFRDLKHFKTSAFQPNGKRAEFSLFPIGEPHKLFEIFANQDANLEGSPFLDGLTNLTRLGFYEFSGLNSSVDVHGPYIEYVSNEHIFKDGPVTIDNLAGSGSRVVVADANGVLSTVANSVTTSGSYSPTITGATNITINQSTVKGTYIKVGNIVNVQVSLEGTPTANQAITFSCPVPFNRVGNGAVYMGGVSVFDSSATNNIAGTVRMSNVTSTAVQVSYRSSVGTNTHSMSINFQYDVTQ